MASLSPAVWLVVGVLVTIVSLLMPQMRVFVVPGVLFIIVGFVKILLANRSQRVLKNRDNYHTTSPRIEQQNVPETKVCFVCSSRNSAKANFCGHCGHRLQ